MHNLPSCWVVGLLLVLLCQHCEVLKAQMWSWSSCVFPQDGSAGSVIGQQ